MEKIEVKLGFVQPFFMIENEIVDIEDITPKERFIYMVLSRYANSVTKECFPSITTLAKKTGYGRATVIESIKSLVKKGYLIKENRVDGRGQQNNLYTILPINQAFKGSPVENYPSSVENYPSSVQNYPSSVENSKNTNIKNTNIKNTNISVTGEFIDKVIEEWNKLSDLGIVPIRNISNNRLKSLRARLEEYSENEIIQAIQLIRLSNFLTGKNDRNWKIKFDWLLNPNNFIKVIEGNYTDKEEDKPKKKPLFDKEEYIRRMKEESRRRFKNAT